MQVMSMMIMMMVIMEMEMTTMKRRGILLRYIHLLCKTLAAHVKLFLTRREESFFSSQMLDDIVSMLPRRNAGAHLASVRNAEEEEQMEKLVTAR